MQAEGTWLAVLCSYYQETVVTKEMVKGTLTHIEQEGLPIETKCFSNKTYPKYISHCVPTPPM